MKPPRPESEPMRTAAVLMGTLRARRCRAPPILPPLTRLQTALGSLQLLPATGTALSCQAAAANHVECCEDCAYRRICYNSCRNRHRPKCQAAAAKQWLADRQADVHPAGTNVRSGVSGRSEQGRPDGRCTVISDPAKPGHAVRRYRGTARRGYIIALKSSQRWQEKMPETRVNCFAERG